jgi:predicted AlkP superfamily pyrophosphatase or phosphodiesterase
VSTNSRIQLILFLLGCGLCASSAPGYSASKPKLAVVIVFDQLRADYLEKWRPYFGNGGFRRLLEEGAWFTNCHYPYARTVTAAGHASLLTGCTPRDHAIVDNGWYDRPSGTAVAAVTGDNPSRRQAPTVGDMLTSESRQVSMSMKPRSAILLAAAKGADVYWFSKNRFVTSAYYRPALPAWVEQFNSRKLVEKCLGKAWNRLRTDISYGTAGSDDVFFEGTGSGQGRTFPHPTPDTAAFENSPFGNDLLVSFAREAIVAEQLGHHAGTDLLTISFSANDLVGHVYGPDSQEVFDITLRSDVLMKEFLEFLDKTVGKDNYLVCISADHGVSPIPGLAKEQGKESGYVYTNAIVATADTFLKEHYGPQQGIKTNDELNLYLKQPSDAVNATLARYLVTQPGIQAAYTRAELLQETRLQDRYAELFRQCSHPDSCGDVVLLQKPYHLAMTPTTPEKGTNHGTPYDYDTHVPLLAMGPGIRPGVYTQPVTPEAMTFIVQHSLQVPVPAKARAEFAPPVAMWRTR